MTRQFVVVTGDGSLFGVVLDASPMTSDQAALHIDAFGARLPGDVVAWARSLGRGHPWVVSEVVYRPVRFSHGGRSRRRYAAVAFCRVVASSMLAARAA